MLRADCLRRAAEPSTAGNCRTKRGNDTTPAMEGAWKAVFSSACWTLTRTESRWRLSVEPAALRRWSEKGDACGHPLFCCSSATLLPNGNAPHSPLWTKKLPPSGGEHAILADRIQPRVRGWIYCKTGTVRFRRHASPFMNQALFPGTLSKFNLTN